MSRALSSSIWDRISSLKSDVSRRRFRNMSFAIFRIDIRPKDVSVEVECQPESGGAAIAGRRKGTVLWFGGRETTTPGNCRFAKLHMSPDHGGRTTRAF